MADAGDGYSVTPLLDGVGVFPEPMDEVFPDATPLVLAAAATVDPVARDGPRWRLSYRCFAIRAPGRPCVIVDTGVGGARNAAAHWTPTPGDLPGRLDAAGIDPLTVGAVVLTHLHADHAGGIVTDEGEPLFPHAAHLLQRAELRSASPVVGAAVATLRGLGLLQVVTGDHVHEDSGHGRITVVSTPGHTPGHQSVLVESPAGDVWVTGDVVVHAVQVVDPTVAYSYDQHPDQAHRTREILLADARARGALLATAHLGPAFVSPTVPAPRTGATRHTRRHR